MPAVSFLPPDPCWFDLFDPVWMQHPLLFLPLDFTYLRVSPLTRLPEKSPPFPLSRLPESPPFKCWPLILYANTLFSSLLFTICWSLLWSVLYKVFPFLLLWVSLLYQTSSVSVSSPHFRNAIKPLPPQQTLNKDLSDFLQQSHGHRVASWEQIISRFGDISVQVTLSVARLC